VGTSANSTAETAASPAIRPENQMPTGPGSYRATASPAGARASGRHPAPLMRTSVRDGPGKRVPPVQTALERRTSCCRGRRRRSSPRSRSRTPLPCYSWRSTSNGGGSRKPPCAGTPGYATRLSSRSPRHNSPSRPSTPLPAPALSAAVRLSSRSALSQPTPSGPSPPRTAGVSRVRDPVSRRAALVEERKRLALRGGAVGVA
jgi:hypothetical protein